jgi:hypothetical protein
LDDVMEVSKELLNVDCLSKVVIKATKW